ncbi:uncharacterized protein LOC18438793 isoform X9 [Amborella trichopoda]|uniref:uncharacterized protein LOC18438793 isoform X9 n=1 Tax=Amborella trichopoda TaxID=13333 RepID=UPI0009C05611|nr:uncharacterized protein LOC18438793 isoform X9 [Amborella trichopoda]|eukprot:XP_020525836.1 uncharacterized protein LOC18438793 isoform X9 [Amborella trichopoda]
MDPLLWHRVAAVSGVAALGLGTYGAHVFQPHNPAYKDFGSLLTTGILAFSGTTSYGRLGDGAIRNMDMMLDIMSNQEVTSINLAHINATSLCL